MLHAISDKDVMVRKNTVNHLPHPNDEQFTALEQQLPDSSYELTATLLEKLCALKPASAAKYISAVENTEGAVGHNVLVKRLELKWIYQQDQSALQQLIKLSSNAYEFRTRMFAMGALKRADYLDDNLLAFLVEGMTSGNYRLNNAATEVLFYFHTQNKYRKLIDDYVDSKLDAAWKVKKVKDLLSNFKG